MQNFIKVPPKGEVNRLILIYGRNSIHFTFSSVYRKVHPNRDLEICQSGKEKFTVTPSQNDKTKTLLIRMKSA